MKLSHSIQKKTCVLKFIKYKHNGPYGHQMDLPANGRLPAMKYKEGKAQYAIITTQIIFLIHMIIGRYLSGLVGSVLA